MTTSGGTETDGIHTSCSQPLAAGDVFGSLTVVTINGQRAGDEVTYFYEVRNLGSTPVTLSSLSDDKLGELLQAPQRLGAGRSFSIQKSAVIDQNTTNTVTASAEPIPTGANCQAEDSVTVSVP